MTGPRSGRRRGPLFFFFFFLLVSSAPPIRQGYIRGVQYCNRVCIWMFLVRYIMTGCIFRAPSALWQGQVLTPQRHPPIHLRSRVPPPGAVDLVAFRERRSLTNFVVLGCSFTYRRRTSETGFEKSREYPRQRRRGPSCIILQHELGQ